MNKKVLDGIKKITAMFTVGCMVFSAVVVNNVVVSKAEVISHPHAWATKYDDKNHWEYCTVCNKEQNKKAHDCKDHWFDGKESCATPNFSTRICECGYNYVYDKPHGETSSWIKYPSRLIHYNKCNSCSYWIKSERCKNSKGELSCKNPGKCSVCGGETTKNNHFVTKDGKCRDCGQAVVEITNKSVKYASDYKTATAKFTMKPKMSGVVLTGKMNQYSPDPNYSNSDWKSADKSDGSYEFTGVYTFNPDKQRKCTVNVGDTQEALTINGEKVYMDAQVYKFQIWQDQTKPEVTEVKQKDQKTANGWATIKELTINGKEDLSKIVTITILDKATKDISVDKAKVEVKDGKFSYKCTPPLEGPAEGRPYIVKVEDQVGNVKEHEFKIVKTDCKAPTLRSDKSYTTWSKTKKIEFKINDYGSGKVQTSMNDEKNYKDAKASGDDYIATYSFAEDNYDVTEYKLYFRDGLGNTVLEKIKIGKVDNTKPTITDVKGSLNYEVKVDEVTNSPSTSDSASANKPIGAIVEVTANDKNTTLNKEGSGVAAYAMVQSKEVVKDSEWQKVGTPTPANVFDIRKAGVYYVWVKDAAGNKANLKTVTVKDDFSIEVGADVELKDDEKDKDKEDSVKLPTIENPSKENEKKKDNDDDDKTPPTGDNSFVLAAVILLAVSAMILIIIKKKKRYV